MFFNVPVTNFPPLRMHFIAGSGAGQRPSVYPSLKISRSSRVVLFALILEA